MHPLVAIVAEHLHDCSPIGVRAELIGLVGFGACTHSITHEFKTHMLYMSIFRDDKDQIE